MTETTTDAPVETPTETLRRAAKLMRKRAEAATPGPWERPLDVRNKAIVIAELPAGEKPRQWIGGIIPAEFASHGGPTGRYAGQRERVSVVQCNTWSDGTHDRKRNGRDLEYIAAMHPLVGSAVADFLDHTASLIEANKGRFGDTQSSVMAIIIARTYLGEVPA